MPKTPHRAMLKFRLEYLEELLICYKRMKLRGAKGEAFTLARIAVAKQEYEDVKNKDSS